MDNDWEEYILRRCGEALEEDKLYMDKELNEKVNQDELQVMAEKLCYLKGVRDTFTIILKLQS